MPQIWEAEPNPSLLFRYLKCAVASPLTSNTFIPDKVVIFLSEKDGKRRVWNAEGKGMGCQWDYPS